MTYIRHKSFNLDAMTVALAGDPDVREKLTRDFGLRSSRSPDDFIGDLLKAFDQKPFHDPLNIDRHSSEFFLAAVRALGSNSRSWASFVRREPELMEFLDVYNPEFVQDRVDAGGLAVDDLLEFFPGQSQRGDATAVLAWAKRLSTRDFGAEVRALDGALGICHIAEHDCRLPTEHMMPTIVAFLANPAARWKGYGGMRAHNVADNPKELKLSGMGPALGSEFFRNLGWSGFKPDRHVMRLLDRWAPDVVAAQEAPARRLAQVIGRRDKGTLAFLRYSLAGQALTPPGTSYSMADNLVWAVGAYVEKNGRETNRTYVRTGN